ncbi:BTAD domain-containing putative transcriptional regulator [Microbacter sp. GSS18]|nr:BTAD domain-containing putative transcriptional regulator [Microbacter sp. GSS18]
MTVRILGPLDIGGPELSPRERTVLATLIVRRGSVVTSAELADALWHDEFPATWPQQVRNAVARIRSRLGAEAITTVGDGYVLGIDADAIDAVVFERLVAEGRRFGLEGSHERAVASFRRALALWRGTPLPDVASWPPGEIEALRLSEVRASVEDELLDARLRSGEQASVIADAERLVREDPLRERRWGLLALANYRADRQAEAMAVLRAARTRLAEDLGVDPSRGLVELETAILRHDASLDAPAHDLTSQTDAAAAACPWRGLAAYDETDDSLFFGRDEDVRAVLARCRPRSIVTIVGPSGSGKSSLMRAGVVPRLREQGRGVKMVAPDGASSAVFDDRASVIGIDQAEELLALPPENMRELSARAATWVERGGCLILTLRSDVLDRATALPDVGAELGRGVYALSPLDTAMLHEAVTGPAAATGLRLEPGLLEVVLRDAGERAGILPALSHALTATWARREGSTLTLDGYEAAGGIAGAIAQSAEHVYASFSAQGRDVCRSLMMRLIERTPEGVTVRRRVPLSTLTADPLRRSVVERLVTARLVTVDGDAAMIAHEAVGRTWPRLDGWLTEDAANARILRGIEQAAAAWNAAGGPEEDLLRGGRLHAALEWREDSSPDLTEVEAAFLDAAAERQQNEVRELAARATRERANNRRLRLSLAAAAVLLVAALVATGIAALRGAEAQASASDARIEALAATSLSIRDSDRDVAALLAAELYRRHPDDPRARSALLGSLTGGGGLMRTIRFDAGSLASARLIPGTDTALVVTDAPPGSRDGGDTMTAVVDLDTGAVIEELDVPLPAADFQIWRDIVISEDASTAFIQTGALRPEGTCCANHMTAIDLASGTLNFDTVLVDARTGQKPAISPDGSRAYVAHWITGAPSLIDLTTGEVFASREHDPEEFENIPGRYNGLALIDGRLYVGMDDHIAVYDPDSLRPVDTIELPGESLTEILIMDDASGGLIAVGDSGAVRVDLATSEVLWRQGAALRCVSGVAVPPSSFLCATGIGLVKEHDLETGQETGRNFDTLSEDNYTVDVLPGGDEFVTVVPFNPPSLQRWRIDGAPAITRPVAEGFDLTDGFGASGSMAIIRPRADVVMGLLPSGTVLDTDPELEYMRLWDLEADAPVGEPAFGMIWLSDTVVARLDRGVTWTLEDVASGDRHPVTAIAESDEAWLLPGGPGGHAWAITSDSLIAFDPETGEASADPIALPFDGAREHLAVSEIPGTGRVLVTWRSRTEGVDRTAVFDIGTGEELARGLEHDSIAIALPDGTILSANAERMLRSDADLSPLEALAKAGTAPMHMTVSGDGRLLLTASFDQRMALYDLTDGRRLGDEIIGAFDPDNFWPVGFLRDDGQAMVTSSDDGVLVWDLRPDALRDAVCTMVSRELTDLEWRTYLGDERDAQTCPAQATSVAAG